jgi:hypothetical protein
MRRRRYVRLRYRWSVWTLAVPGAIAAGAVATAIVLNHVAVAAIVLGVAVLAFLAVTIRLSRPLPAGPRSGGDGPAPPGGAGVREPRRPRPVAPAGAAAMPLPDDGRPTAARG